jgi:cytochrome P450
LANALAVPFYTPDAAKGILQGNKVLEKYDLKRPLNDNEIASVQTQEGCKQVFDDPETFTSTYQAALRDYTGVDSKHHRRSKGLFEDDFQQNVSDFFTTTVRSLIKKNSLQGARGRMSVDIVRDVINIAPILFLADRFALPLKTQERPRGLLTIFETFKVYLALFTHQNFNIIPDQAWKVREGATEAAASLRPIFETHIKTQSGKMEGLVDWMTKGSAFAVGPHADRIYHALSDSGLSRADQVKECMGIGASVAGNVCQLGAVLIDLYLRPEYSSYKDRIVELAHMSASASEFELQGFVHEGLRHASVLPGISRVATKDVTINDGVRGPVSVKKGHTVLVATSKAAMDPIAFPDPEVINPHRRFEDYTLLKQDAHAAFCTRMLGPALAATLREVFKLRNVRRAPGKQGRFTVTQHAVGGVEATYYLDSDARESLFPTGLRLHYEGDDGGNGVERANGHAIAP